MKNIGKHSTSLRSVFAKVLAEETNKYALLPGLPCERPIAELPELLQQHLRRCGFEGRESVVCCRFNWKNTFLKFKPGGKWVPLKFLQVNFVPRPTRLVLMTTRLWGLFPFGGIDKYQDGRGSLMIRILNRIKVADEHGKKMDQAELVTLLAETLILPAYALQSYITWATIDAHTVKGTITDGVNTASGLFRFDEQGLLNSFETNDRYYADKGRYFAYRWTASVNNYISRGDMLIPSTFQATWHMPQGDHQYFKGELFRLDFNSTVLSDSLNGPAAAPEEEMDQAKQQHNPVQLVQNGDPNIVACSTNAKRQHTQDDLHKHKG